MSAHSPSVEDWHQANQRHLMTALAGVRHALQEHAARGGKARSASAAAGPGTRTGGDPPWDPPWDPSRPPALDALCQTFGLSPFERDVLLLCAGPELDSGFGALCAEAQGAAHRTGPTFGLALAALPGAHWSALTPVSPLRRWRLVELGAGDTLAASPVRIDERILHYLTGISHLDERLQGLVEPLPVPEELPASHRAVAGRIASAWVTANGAGRLPVVQLCGPDAAGKRGVMAWACGSLGLQPHSMRHADVPSTLAEREALARLLDRETALSGAAVLVEIDEGGAGQEGARPAVLPFVESLHGMVAVSAREPLRGGTRAMTVVDVATPTREEQLDVWRRALGPLSGRLEGGIGAVVGQFDLGVQGIEAAGTQAVGRLDPAGTTPVDEGAVLWEVCRTQARTRLDDLAQRIEPDAAWEDLVLPEPQLQTLREIAAHVRHRAQVYETWGFARKSARGLGISALFTGSSGTGKTMAAEVLANELRLDLYRIDLSQVVSKYIGETEKNLRRVFDAAEAGGSVLLFDEADALFGKRGEVRDSHDRYANIEVSYLLQRMEAYRGLAVLTTNYKSALDTAFLRRLRFVVSFPFPDAAQRAEIWRRVFPADTPVDGLDRERLARLNVAGGNIRNIAISAAFMAADEGAPVRMSHLLRAVRGEYAKLEKPLTDAETGGWT